MDVSVSVAFFLLFFFLSFFSFFLSGCVALFCLHFFFFLTVRETLTHQHAKILSGQRGGGKGGGGRERDREREST